MTDDREPPRKPIERILEERSRAIREGRATFHLPDEIYEVYERMKAARRSDLSQ